MDKTKKKKVQMPSGIRSKLTAAIAMLLISSLLVVGSTYAWFTLSTAPEVTGITTSVGANGNLEIALLNTATYANTGSISSAVGDSSEAAGKNATTANITWGNLVDLSDSTYGLTGIKLLPATLNVAGGVVNPGSFLKTPVYGADGRVASTEANTVSAVYADGAFTYNGTQTYGVRAVGVSSNVSARQIAFNNARNSFTSNVDKAPTAVAKAVNDNSTQFMLIAISGSTPDNYTTEQLAAMLEMAKGAKTSLETIVKAYANAGLAAAAANGSSATDVQVTTLQEAIAGITSAETLKSLLNTAGVRAYDDVLGTLKTAQESVAAAITALEGDGENPAYNESTAGATVVNKVVKPLIGGSDTMTAYDADDQTTEISQGNIGNIKKLYLSGGAIGTIAAQTGNITLANMGGAVNVYGGAKDTTGELVGVATTVGTLTAPSNGAATSNISDTYGYVIDFAFRTNAANSDLMLQTSATNRVYENGGNATQGNGSNVKFTYTTGLSFTQAQTLLNSIKLVFLDPANGTVYATAGLANITDNVTYASADVKLTTQGAAETGRITALNQNTVHKVSVLVYLDGDTVDNTAVINADTSGSLDLNLQFSSSADLTPMQNTALKNK